MITGIKNFFSFLYKAGDINMIIWIINIGVEIKKDANKEIFRFDTKTSGSAVKIILLFDEFSNIEK